MWKYFVYTSKYTYIITIIDRDMIGDEIHIYDTLSGMNSHYDKHNRDEIHIYDTLSGMTSHCDKHNRHVYDSVPGMMYSHYEKYNVTH